MLNDTPWSKLSQIFDQNSDNSVRYEGPENFPLMILEVVYDVGHLLKYTVKFLLKKFKIYQLL